RRARLGRRAARLRLGAARRREAGAARRRARARRRDRRQVADGDARRQAVAQRHRSRRRAQELPLRAGLHLRAAPHRRRRRGAPRVRGKARRAIQEVEEVMADKRISEAEVVARLSDGMTIGIGGWGSRRKPMSLVRAILRSPLRDLTIVSFGGPDVGLLCAANKVRKLVYGFVSLDSIPLEPHFRAARQRGAVEVVELDEGMLQWGLYAASLRLPFLPTRAGLGSDVLVHHPELRTVRSPYADATELVAVPALTLDAALVHL